jgi:hypothetical protein
LSRTPAAIWRCLVDVGAGFGEPTKIDCQLGPSAATKLPPLDMSRSCARKAGSASSARRSALGRSRIGFQNGLLAMAMPAVSNEMRTSSGRQPTCGTTCAPPRWAAAAASMMVSAPAGSNGLASNGAQVTGRRAARASSA